MSRIRKTAVGLALCMLVAALQGCVAVNFTTGETVVRGEGEVVTRSYETERFTQLEVNGNMEVIYQKADVCTVSLAMQENLFDYVTVSANDGKVTVDGLKGAYSGSGIVPALHITAPYLEELILSGTVTLEGSETFAGERLTIETAGASEISASMEVERLRVVTAGAGALRLSGTAQYAQVELAGAGAVDAFGLQTTELDIEISGAGSASVYCTDKLRVDISGIGSLEYKGDPVLQKNISGLGNVEKAD